MQSAKTREAFDFLNVRLNGLVNRCKNGGYQMWNYSPPSVWMTAWVMRNLYAVQLEEWENLIYVDPNLITASSEFLLRHQRNDGSFGETDTYHNYTLDHKMTFKDEHGGASVALTALVCISLHHWMPSMQGSSRAAAIQSTTRGIRYLELRISTLQEPFDVAITAWALSLLGSSEKEVAFQMLHRMRRAEGHFVYWSGERMVTNEKIFENNQRAFVSPRDPQTQDSLAVEATSYALLAYLRREGVTADTESMMRWLHSVRDFDFAFVSTVDSIVAMEALAEFAYRARVRDVTDMTLSVEATADPRRMDVLRLSNQSLSSYTKFLLERAWGHVHVEARGAGQAVAQLELQYGVDVPRFIEQPAKKYFNLTVDEKYSRFNNKSLIDTSVCVAWAATDERPHSHAAILEVEVPTGYRIYQTHCNQVAKRAAVEGPQQLRDCSAKIHRTFFSFDFVPSHPICYTYTLERWQPAANLSSVRSATIMEVFATEHFETTIINSSSLAYLDICEVCGSYQCPYCPSYSRGTPIVMLSLLTILTSPLFVLSLINIIF